MPNTTYIINERSKIVSTDLSKVASFKGLSRSGSIIGENDFLIDYNKQYLDDYSDKELVDRIGK